MVVKFRTSPFGGTARTRVLLALQLLEESYPRELERMLEAPLIVVQRALRSLERDGLVAGRQVGRSRLFRINPRYFAVRELRAFLDRLAEPDTTLQSRVASLRRRPRMTGKPL
jgi:DNA-binding transcriptional ArsR family regulator